MTRATAFALLLVLYAWWASGVRPFSALGYVLLAVPSMVVVILLAAGGGFAPHEIRANARERAVRPDTSIATAWPWLAMLALAVALEIVGIALGGRSTTVPTLSTTLDHLLVTHVVRWLLYVAWLSVGATPLARLWQRRHPAAPQ